MAAKRSSVLADDAAALFAQTPGHVPGADALTQLGGWARLAADGPSLADNLCLPAVMHLAAREAPGRDRDDDHYPAAVSALAAAVMACDSPALLIEGLDAIADTPAVLDVVGPGLGRQLEAVVDAFHDLPSPDGKSALRAAAALELLTRLIVGGYGSKFTFFATLDRFNAPVPKRLATAIVRSVGTAADFWPEAADLDLVVRRLAGIEPPPTTARASGDPADVASDATWVLAGIAVVQALRASDLPAMMPLLQKAADYLTLGRDTYGRADAEILLTVLETLIALLAATGQPPTVGSLDEPGLARAAVDDLLQRTHSLLVSTAGEDHWYGGPKLVSLEAWANLVKDLARLREEFERDSFYQAEVVVDDLLQIWTGDRAISVVRREADVAGVLQIVQPVIETGFAARAGLLLNLEDHTRALQSRADNAVPEARLALTKQLGVAQTVLAAARAHAQGAAAPGKVVGGAAPTPLPPPFDQLIPAGSPAAAGLGRMDTQALAELARAVDARAFGSRSLNVIERQVFTDIRRALASSPDSSGERGAAVDQILHLVIRFVTSRVNAQSDRFAYLFDPAANEDAIHNDLHNFLLASELGSIVEFETQHIGGGRVDLRLNFSGYAIHIEMKVDSTKIPMNDKPTYLKQAAAYQVTDVRIGFLIALRHRAFDKTGPPPHLTQLIGHTTLYIEADPVPRHLVLVEVPGSRTTPSQMR